MTWLLVSIVTLLISGLAIVYLARYLGKVAKELLGDLLKAVKKEKDDVLIQRALLAKDMFGMNMMAKQMDDTHKRVQDSIQTVKALSARINDPSWMRKFEEGRDNAQWN